MTRIEAVIQPHGMDALREALESVGLTALTTCEVKGSSRRAGAAPVYRGAAGAGELAPRLKLEVVVPSPFLPRVLDALARAARGGRLAGTIFATPVDQAVRIRTGERGEGAL